MRLSEGAPAPAFMVEDLTGRRVALEDYRGRTLLLCFLRYASCPMCLLRVYELVRRHAELAERGVDVVVVFHSPAARLRRHLQKLRPSFPVVADPARALYARYGVESSWPRLLGSSFLPSFYRDFAVAAVRGYWGGAIDGDPATMPADFVIGPDGVVRRARYGREIGDHLPLGEVRALPLATPGPVSVGAA